MTKRILNKVGLKFGKLTVLKLISKIKKNNKTKTLYKCECDCGVICKIETGNLNNRNTGTKSCGCSRQETRLKKLLSQDVKTLNKVYTNYKCASKRRKLDFSLSKKQVKEFIFSNCYYCGSSPKNYRKIDKFNRAEPFNGLDRIDNTKGYLKNNVVPCCRICNRAKGELSKEEFYIWAHNLHNNLENK